MVTRAPFVLLAGLLAGAWLDPAPAAAQTPSPPVAGFASNLPATGWLSATDPILLRIAPATLPPGARIAVFIGRTDWTSLFAATAEGLEYRPRTLTLPAGEHEVIVYAVTPANVWTEQARFPLRIRTLGGLEKADAAPALDVAFRSQLDEGHAPAENAPPRPTFRDVTLTGGVKALLARGGVEWSLESNVVGVTNRPEALRFAERADEAPRIDLSSYAVKVAKGRASALLGHLTFGGSRHLITGFASRGVSVAVPLGSRADAAFMLANGTTIVGWANPFGLNDGDHRVIAGTVGVELVAGRPGGLRLEGTWLDGSRRPVSGFTQSAITDREKSQGVSGRVVAADARSRARVDAGYTRSRFTNPFDPLLAQGTPIVAVSESAHGARYLDAAYDLVHNAKVGAGSATVTALFRHERVDPLFKSVAGAVAADRQENVFELQARIGEATFQAGHTRMHDNLEEIPSLLSSRTERNAATASVPLGSVFGASGRAAAFVPRVSYTLDRVHQAGQGVPENSDFSATHVPDQITFNQTFNVDWERARLRAGYRFARSLIDNRHIGQERADLLNLTNAVTAALTFSMVNLTADVSFDRAQNLELLTTDRTKRLALIGDWRITTAVGLTSNASLTWLGDDRRTSQSRATDLALEGYWQVALRRRPTTKPAMRIFVRYARQSGRVENFLFGVPPALRTGWTVNAGVNLSVF